MEIDEENMKNQIAVRMGSFLKKWAKHVKNA